jgi:1,4-alpha-glucan branching enzyme
VAHGTLALVLELHHRLPAPGASAGADWAAAAVDLYWPLALALDGLADAGLADALTLAVSPAWTALAADPDARRDVRARLDAMAADPDAGRLDALRQFAVDRWAGDLLAPLRDAAERGVVRLVPVAAAHAWLPSVACLPLLARALTAAAADDHAARFGAPAAGLWLPHGAYTPELDAPLGAAGLRFTAVPAHDFVRGTVRPPRGPFEILVTPPGVAVFAIDADPGRQLPSYRDPGNSPGSGRSLARARAFAASWRASVADRARWSPAPREAPPISLAALSVHDLGRDGVAWLADLVLALAEESGWPLTTPERHLDRHPEGPLGRPGTAAGGWLAARPVGADLLDRVRDAADALTIALDGPAAATPLGRRVLSQALREVLLAGALDWEIPAHLPAEAGLARARERLDRAGRLLARLAAGALDGATVAALEAGPAYLPDLDPARLRDP